MQHLITANSLRDLRDEVNEYLERGWTIVPGSIGISSFRVVSHPNSERPRTPDGESFRVGCWAVVKYKSPLLPESSGTVVPSTPSSGPANPPVPGGLPTGANHAPSGAPFTAQPTSPEQGTAVRRPAADLTSGEALFSAQAETPRSGVAGETVGSLRPSALIADGKRGAES